METAEDIIMKVNFTVHLLTKKEKKDGLWEWFNKDGSLEKTQTWVEDEMVN